MKGAMKPPLACEAEVMIGQTSVCDSAGRHYIPLYDHNSWYLLDWIYTYNNNIRERLVCDVPHPHEAE
jgi:hypothetical protein